jgi:hypothetical protein
MANFIQYVLDTAQVLLHFARDNFLTLPLIWSLFMRFPRK